MHHANHFYGHAHILARYAGLAEAPRIWGYLQHGWNIHDGFAVGTSFAPGYPKFVWSEAPARRGWAAGLRNYMVIGSPWAYLLELEQQRALGARAAAPRGDDRLPLPRVGAAAHPREPHGYVEEIQATEDGPITVCLYWNEYHDPEVRRAYERAGFRVISHGYRGHMWKDTDTDFLDRQLAELRHTSGSCPTGWAAPSSTAPPPAARSASTATR